MKLPQLLEAGSVDHPLVIVRSGFWQFNAAGFFDGDEALVIDPGIFPEDIALLGAAVTTRSTEGTHRDVRHVVLTHSHHDHIRGWMQFPGAQVTMPKVAAEKDLGPRTRILAAKTKLDERLGIEDAGFAYPTPDRTFDQPCSLTIGSQAVHLYPLFGHSNCCSVVWIPALRTLFSADYLVTPGTPYCRWEADAMESALDWLASFVEEHDVQTVWPAHYAPHQGPQAIREAIKMDRGAMRVLREACSSGLESGHAEDTILRSATQAARAWRGTDTKASRLQDADNARRVLANCRSDRSN